MAMNTSISALLNRIDTNQIQFVDVIAFIDKHYEYAPVSFVNGDLHNPLGVNEGSAKIFSFAQLNGLDKLDTLLLFCEYYQAVKANPNGHDHPNIRNFMQYGWQGFGMPTHALSPRLNS